MVEYGIAAGGALGHGGGNGASSALDRLVTLSSSPTGLALAAGAVVLLVLLLR